MPECANSCRANDLGKDSWRRILNCRFFLMSGRRADPDDAAPRASSVLYSEPSHGHSFPVRAPVRLSATLLKMGALRTQSTNYYDCSASGPFWQVAAELFSEIDILNQVPKICVPNISLLWYHSDYTSRASATLNKGRNDTTCQVDRDTFTHQTVSRLYFCRFRLFSPINTTL